MIPSAFIRTRIERTPSGERISARAKCRSRTLATASKRLRVMPLHAQRTACSVVA